MLQDEATRQSFTMFVEDVEARLRLALIPIAGLEPARDATADALAYAWEHWRRIETMENPAGYLYRVAQTSLRKARRQPPVLPAVDRTELPWVEPGLPEALSSLSPQQRTVVWLVHGLSWTQAETAGLLDVSPDTVRTHLERGMSRLRKTLGGDDA